MKDYKQLRGRNGVVNRHESDAVMMFGRVLLAVVFAAIALLGLYWREI